MRILHLDKEKTLQNINDLIKIDSIIPDDPWTADNFLMDLDHKWEFSFFALQNNDIIGFLICSMKENALYIHRIAVLPEHQKKKIGITFIQNLYMECQKYNIDKITLRVIDTNLPALEFYKGLGFKQFGKDGSRYLFEKNIK